jgi:outer membrane protein
LNPMVEIFNMKKTLFSLFILTTQSLWALEPSTIHFTTSLQEALSVSEKVQIAQKKLQQTQNTASLGNLSLLPRLYVKGGLSQSWVDDLNPAVASAAPSGEASASNPSGDNTQLAKTATVGLDWTLFDGMRMFKARSLVFENESLERLNLKSLQSELKVAFSKKWIDVLMAQFQLGIFEKRLAVSEALSLRLEDKYNLGLVDRRQFLQAKLAYKQSLVSVLTQKRTVQSALQNLALVMGADIKDFDVKLSAELPEIEISAEIEEAWRLLEQQNLALKVENKKLKVADYNYGLARSKHFPMIKAFADYGWSQSEFDYGSPAPLVNRENATARVGLSLNWNIFSGYEDEMGRRNARIDMEMAQISTGLFKKQLRVNLEDVFEGYQRSLETFEIEKESRILAHEQWEISQEMYHSGQITQLDYLNAQILMENGELSLFSAQMQVFLAKINIESLVN